MAKTFSALEKNILKAKGLSAPQLARLFKAGVRCREDFRTVGDPATLAELAPGLKKDVAAAVLAWAVGGPATALSGKLLVDSSDVVYCSHCQAKQPKDYASGDLCPSCGREAEPILACFWCSAAGPGRFCRQCGAEFVPAPELDLAVQLKRDGLPKDEVPKRLKAMSADDKNTLWGRLRKSRT